MTVTTQFQIGPSYTPRVIRVLILITVVGSLVAAMSEAILGKLVGVPGLQWGLSLSVEGLARGFLWQPLTHFFIQQPTWGGISLNLMLQLLFHMYLLWVLGTAIVVRSGEKSFLCMFLTAGILSGLLAVSVAFFWGGAVHIAGSAAVIYAVMIAWSMLHPRMELLLFLTFNVQGRWLIFGYLAALLLVSLAQLDVVGFVLILTGAATGYFFALLAWGSLSPFSSTHAFDRFVQHWGGWVYAKCVGINSSYLSDSKIIDITTGKPQDVGDDAFVDEMLAKISRSGEKSLSWRERWRLSRISRKKRNK